MSSLLPTENKLTTTFAYHTVEDVADFNLSALERDHSTGAPSEAPSTTARATRRIIGRAEPCFVTKQRSYTLERVHWVNAVKKNPLRKKEIETFLQGLGIVHVRFDLNDTTNLTNLDCSLHVSLEKYGFFAVTASLTTLQRLIGLVKEQNRVWQDRFDSGRSYVRDFDLFNAPIVNAQYELVVLHPEHFLPKGTGLTVYTHANGQLSGKSYVIGQDRTLRESPGTLDCPRLPAFDFDADRSSTLPLNVFLVLLNAGIKFRRYKRMLFSQHLPNLPKDVEDLIDTTIQLVDLIYWKPVETLTPYHERAARSAPAMEVDVQDVRDGEMGIRTNVEDDDEASIERSRYPAVKRPGANATLEERRDYGQYLMSGRDLDLDSDDEDLLEELGLPTL